MNEINNPDYQGRHKRTYLLLIVACAAASFFCLTYPVYVIRPFRNQGVRELAAALAILRFRPAAMALAMAVALLAAMRYWQVQRRTWRRIAAALGVAAVGLFAGLSRINIYELMFHPVGHPDFVSRRETKLDGDEKVIAVRMGGAARAYPIRSISYHHVVNDVVGGGRSWRRIERSVTPVWCGGARSTGCG